MARDGCFGLSLQPGEPAAKFEGVVAGWKSSELGRVDDVQASHRDLVSRLGTAKKEGMDVSARPVSCFLAGARVDLYLVGPMSGAPQPVSVHFGVGPDPEHVADPVR